MANQIFNIALGRMVEFYNRVDQNDPINAAFVIIAWVTTASDLVLKRLDTVAAIQANLSTAEATNAGYVRRVLTDADLTVFAPDDVNDRTDLDIPDQTFSAVSAGDVWTDLTINYDSDSTSGNDANIVPMSMHDFAANPSGGDITASIAAAGFARFE